MKTQQEKPRRNDRSYTVYFWLNEDIPITSHHLETLQTIHPTKHMTKVNKQKESA